MRTAATLLLSLVVVIAPLSARALPTPVGPVAQLKEQNGRIDKILKRKPAAGSPDEKAAKEELKTVVNNLLDYNELAKRALGPHWDKVTPVQQGEFVSTLRELIEKNYVKHLRTSVDYQVTYNAEKVTDGEATVATVLKVRTSGKSTDSSIDYKLHKVAARWLVYDVITDEVSMVRNYRTTFNKIITTDGYDALLKKMRKKIEALDEVNPKATAAAK